MQLTEAFSGGPEQIGSTAAYLSNLEKRTLNADQSSTPRKASFESLASKSLVSSAGTAELARSEDTVEIIEATLGEDTTQSKEDDVEVEQKDDQKSTKQPLLRKLSTNTNNYLRWLREEELEIGLQHPLKDEDAPAKAVISERLSSEQAYKAPVTRESSSASSSYRQRADPISRKFSQESSITTGNTTQAAIEDDRSLSRQDSEVSFLRSILRARNLESDDDDDDTRSLATTSSIQTNAEHQSLSRDSSIQSSRLSRQGSSTGSYLGFLSRRQQLNSTNQAIKDFGIDRAQSITEEDDDDVGRDEVASVLDFMANCEEDEKELNDDHEPPKGGNMVNDNNSNGSAMKNDSRYYVDVSLNEDKKNSGDSNYESSSARSSAANVTDHLKKSSILVIPDGRPSIDVSNDSNYESSSPYHGSARNSASNVCEHLKPSIVVVPDKDMAPKEEEDAEEDEDGEFLVPGVTYKKDSGYGSQGQIVVGKVSLGQLHLQAGRPQFRSHGYILSHYFAGPAAQIPAGS